MPEINRVTLLGRLGRDPEIRQTNNGQPVASLSVATSESYKDSRGEWQKITDWHKVVAWGDKLVSACAMMRKGSIVMVEGKLKTRSWEKDGKKQYVTEINAVTVAPVVNPKPAEAGAPIQSPVTVLTPDDDSIPF